MPVLPHTGLTVPRPQVTVTGLACRPPENGGALLAPLRHDRIADRIGVVIVERGNVAVGILPEYQAAYDAFAAACRHGGQPVDPARLALLLIEERQTLDVLQQAAAEDASPARLVHDGTARLFVLLDRLPPGEHAHVAVLDETARRATQDALLDPDYQGPGAWELWNGSEWTPLAA